jgi:hypothetical protein
MKKSPLSKALQRQRKHALKGLAEAEHYTVRPELYIRHWKNALLIATTDSEDEQELYYKLQREGKGPKSFKMGRAVRITETAANEWIALLEAAAA